MRTKTLHSENGDALHVPDSYELQNGSERFGQYDEVGSPGLESYSGFITKAYVSDLYWPGVAPIYNRMWRSDPEVTIVRHLFSAWAGKLSPEWVVPEMKGPDGEPLPASDDDKAAAYFANTAMEDMEGGIGEWLATAMTRVPFFGFGYWEAVPGLRRDGWTAPDDDPWQSEHDDGLVGLRRLGFRDYSSFLHWDLDDRSGRVRGLVQHDPPNEQRTIPVDRALHVKYGDMDNPEGLATLEAVYRLERIKYGLEVIQGIGYEHAAGHAAVTTYEKLDASGKATVRRMARALLTAAEGNYITKMVKQDGTPVFDAEVIDTNFQAAPALLEAIRYYGILKLALFGMQFVALSSLSGSGSFAALSDASDMALLMFNNTASGLVQQGGEQLARFLFGIPINADAFPGMTRRPKLMIDEIETPIPLAELGAFLTAIQSVMPLGDDDIIAIRSKTNGVLSETLPDVEMENEPMEPQDEVDDDMPEGDDIPEGEEAPEEEGQLAKRNVLLPADEEPTSTLDEALNPQERAEAAVRRFRRWAGEHMPDLARLLDAEVVDDDDA